jgi:hypothetical protein
MERDGGWTMRSSSSSNMREGLEDQLSSGTASLSSAFSVTNPSQTWQSGIVAFK